MRKDTALAHLTRFKSVLKECAKEGIEADSPIFTRAIKWLREFPVELPKEERDKLRVLITETFSLTDEELRKYAITDEQLASTTTKQQQSLFTRDATDLELELWSLLPKTGFIHRYCEYTSHAESPLAYHLFTAYTTIGCVVSRNVYIDMGIYLLFPNLSVVLIGPSGICRKTSGTNIAVGLLNELGTVKILSEKLTPEALISALNPTAQALLYVPEFSVFLTKQKYMEGMVQLITRLLDNPDRFSVETKHEGKTELTDVALSVLGASTLDWFVKSTPEEIFGGGFINRLFLVIQHDTPREEPIPVRPSEDDRRLLLNHLSALLIFKGEITLAEDAKHDYVEWYHSQREAARDGSETMLANYSQRRPDRVLRLSMLTHLATCHTMRICKECFHISRRLNDWAEQFIGPTLKQMFRSVAGEDTEFVLETIKKAGGEIDHSNLVRRVQYRGNATWLRTILATLKEGRQVKEVYDNVSHFYILTGSAKNDG